MRLKGIAASNGIVVGPVMVYEPQIYDIAESFFESGLEERYLEKFQSAVIQARQELNTLETRLKIENEEKAKIFCAHQQLLQDPELIQRITTCILRDRMNPEYAVSLIFDEYISMFQTIKDPMIAARSIDLSDVKNRILRILSGKCEKNLSYLPKKVIVIAHDLLPSEIATMDYANCLGFVTEMGNTTSHTAIIARSLNLPAVLGVPDLLSYIQDEEQILLDADAGEVIINPTSRDLEKRKEKDEYLKNENQNNSLPCTMLDGQMIELGINIGSEEISQISVSYDYVGLLRTEFLFMGKASLPNEEEQFKVYTHIVEQCSGKVVTLRTLDIGGDKILPSQTGLKEENPALGKRAIRYCFENRDLFMMQLKAALRASAYGPLQLLFPMVSSMDDIYHIRFMLEEAKQKLREEHRNFNEQIKIGVMIEVPAIAFISDLVAKEVDFASIGTNDLTQYLCAADRMNPAMGSYYQTMSPAMIRILDHIFQEFKKNKKPVSVCGELAGDPVAAALLVGLGARILSMSTSNLVRVKKLLSSITFEQTKSIANVCKQLKTEEEIKKYVQNKIKYE